MVLTTQNTTITKQKLNLKQITDSESLTIKSKLNYIKSLLQQYDDKIEENYKLNVNTANIIKTAMITNKIIHEPRINTNYEQTSPTFVNNECFKRDVFTSLFIKIILFNLKVIS